MGRKSIDLALATPAQWVQTILDNFDEFLQDHANCERKASALAMSMVVKHPDREEIIGALVTLAQEELEHFGQVYEVMRARGLPLVKDTPDPYVNALGAHMRHGREQRFLDRMLVSSVVECRGAERFGLIYQALDEPELKEFYRQLWAAETKHGHQFVDMVLKYFSADEVYARLEELMVLEARIVESLPWRPSLH
ncbi:MAG: tRNA-(ms[2]io[6]A)-hydroxylase [Gammaproteobacteria bacterium]|nr:tRNA-(ms[2]io[6]A)-hydroxylase [Gammaproteobacteria bacterium]